MFIRSFLVFIVSITLTSNLLAQSTCQIFSAEEKTQLALDIFGVVPKSLSEEIVIENGNACCVSVSRLGDFGKKISDCFCICPGEISNTRWGSLICQAPFTKFYPSSDVTGGIVKSCDGLVSLDPVPVS